MDTFFFVKKHIILLSLHVLLGFSLYAQSESSELNDSNFLTESLLFLEENSASETASTVPSIRGNTAGLVQALLALLLVLGLVYITIFFLRKLSGREDTSSSHIHILETQNIRSGNVISIVEIANRVFILGIGNNTNLIAEITDKEQIDSIKLSQTLTNSLINKKRFFLMLKEQFSKKNQENNIDNVAHSSVVKKSSFLQNYSKHLRSKSNLTQKNEESDE